MKLLLLVAVALTMNSQAAEVVTRKNLIECTKVLLTKKIAQRGYTAKTLAVSINKRESNRGGYLNFVERFEDGGIQTRLMMKFTGTLKESDIKVEGIIAVLAKKNETNVTCQKAEYYQLAYYNQRSFQMIDKVKGFEID